MLRGYSANEYMVEEVMSPDPIVQEETKTSIAMIEDELSEVDIPMEVNESEDYVYTNEELGFLVTLPNKFSVLSTNEIENSFGQLVEFYLPIEFFLNKVYYRIYIYFK